MEEDEPQANVRLVKLKFPQSYPLQIKTLPLDFKLTASGTVQQISARLFKSFKISTSDVGLCVTQEPTNTSPQLKRQSSNSNIPEISWREFKKSPSFPFFQDDVPLDHYRGVINSIEFIEFKEKAQLPRLKILGDESAMAIGTSSGTISSHEPLLSSASTQPIKLRIAFPPTYPVIAKTFLFSNELTVTQAIGQIATQLNFAAATTVNIGLRPPQTILKTLPDHLLQVLRTHSSPDQYPFLNASQTLRIYQELLSKLDTLEYAYIESPIPPEANQSAAVEDSVADKVLIPIMWRRPDKEGDLYKIAKKNILNRAVKRYFLLQKDKLFIFKDKQQLERPIEAIFLTEYTTITKLDEKFKGRDFILRIEENYSDEKVYYLGADSESEVDSWVNALQKATTKKTLPLQVKHTAHINNRKSVDMTCLFSPSDPTQLFRDLVQLGAGGFSSVWSGIDSRNHQKVVIKLVKVTKITFKYILQEIINHKNFKHPNIVDFIDAFYVPSTQQIWVVLELMSGGDLGKRVNPTNPLKEPEIARILREVLKALQYMHGFNKVHRDIKSDNILFSADSSKVKLADFGFSTKLSGSSARVQSIVGTLHFMAPEILLGQTYSTAIDIWAVGVLAIEMADGVPPNFMCRDITETRAYLQKQGAPRLKDPKLWSPEFNSFISSCLRVEATERPSAEQLLSHPFLSGTTLTRRRPLTTSLGSGGGSLSAVLNN